MAVSDEERVDVISADGTPIAVWAVGHGPPLVLVHGSMQDHTANRSFVDALTDRARTWSVDRRGCGASGDGDRWSIDREFDDVVAVVEAVAERTGEPVALWGHSFGAACAMGGAARTDAVSHLVLYEPSLGLRYPPGSIDTVEQALATGDHDRVITEVLTGVLEMGPDDVAAMRSSPSWQARLATAPTVPRECRAEECWQWRPDQFASITAATLLLTGSESSDDLRAATRAADAAIPGARVMVLEGHGHLAMRADPEMVASIVLDFVRS